MSTLCVNTCVAAFRERARSGRQRLSGQHPEEESALFTGDRALIFQTHQAEGPKLC